MRRMNYPRFDKPTYVGTFDAGQNSFILDEEKGFFPDHEPEPGIYFVIIKDKQEQYEKMQKQEFFCHYVNTQLGLFGNCVGVKITK